MKIITLTLERTTMTDQTTIPPTARVYATIIGTALVGIVIGHLIAPAYLIGAMLGAFGGTLGGAWPRPRYAHPVRRR